LLTNNRPLLTVKRHFLFLPRLPANYYYQEDASGYAADHLEVAPELPPLCHALFAKLLGVFGLVAAALFAGFPEFLSHREISLASGF
jgi:hypothetical protein